MNFCNLFFQEFSKFSFASFCVTSGNDKSLNLKHFLNKVDYFIGISAKKEEKLILIEIYFVEFRVETSVAFLVSLFQQLECLLYSY